MNRHTPESTDRERYGQLTVENRSRIKRFSHGTRFAEAIRLLDPQPGDRILDYGTGDGFFLRRLAEHEPGAQLRGFEPFREQGLLHISEDVRRVGVIHDSIEELEGFAPNKICCLEVLEHLPRRVQDVALGNMSRVLRGPGRIVISAPIEIGPASLAKNIARFMIRQTHPGSSLRNVLLSAVGRTARIPRDESDDYIPSHMGFDHRALERLMREHGFRWTRTYSPLRPLGPVLNSQIFWVLDSRPG